MRQYIVNILLVVVNGDKQFLVACGVIHLSHRRKLFISLIVRSNIARPCDPQQLYYKIIKLYIKQFEVNLLYPILYSCAAGLVWGISITKLEWHWPRHWDLFGMPRSPYETNTLVSRVREREERILNSSEVVIYSHLLQHTVMSDG